MNKPAGFSRDDEGYWNAAVAYAMGRASHPEAQIGSMDCCGRITRPNTVLQDANACFIYLKTPPVPSLSARARALLDDLDAELNWSLLGEAIWTANPGISAPCADRDMFDALRAKSTRANMSAADIRHLRRLCGGRGD